MNKNELANLNATAKTVTKSATHGPAVASLGKHGRLKMTINKKTGERRLKLWVGGIAGDSFVDAVYDAFKIPPGTVRRFWLNPTETTPDIEITWNEEVHIVGH